MKRKVIVAIIMACTLLCGCGDTEPANASTEVLQESVSIEESQEVVVESAEEPSSVVQEEVAESVEETILESEVIVETEAVVSSEPEELPPISERGNTYDFPVERLGYYTNKYWGFDFKQIDGDELVFDKYEYGFLIGENCRYYIMDDNTFNVGWVDDADADVSFADDGSFQLNRYQAQLTEMAVKYYAEDAYRIDVVHDYTKITGEYGMIGSFQKAELGEFEITDHVIQYRMNNSSTMTAEEYQKYLDYYSTIGMQNTQPVNNRRDHEKFPKYIQYIPTEKYYLCGNPDDKSCLWLLKVQTIPPEELTEMEYERFYNPYMYEVELTKFLFDTEKNQWETSASDTGIFRVYSLGESQTKHIGLVHDLMDTPIYGFDNVTDYAENGEAYRFVLDCSNVENGEIYLVSNVTQEVYHTYTYDGTGEEGEDIIENGALFKAYDVDALRALHLKYENNGIYDWVID